MPKPINPPFLFAVPQPRNSAAGPPPLLRVLGLRVGQRLAWRGRPHRLVAFRSRAWAALERLDAREDDIVCYLVRVAELVAGALRAV